MSAQTPTVLERILESTREELERRKRELPLQELEYRALSIGGGGDVRERRFAAALTEPGIAVIAEFKRRSPSAGALREAPDLHEIVGAYERSDAVLVGESLMRSENPEAALRTLRGDPAGSAKRSPRPGG